MPNKQTILQLIKRSVLATAPDATLILYGSYARGEQRSDSDIDLLVLVNKNKVTWDDETKIAYPLYDIEFETGTVISPMIFSKNMWETQHRMTPFYENVKKEGIVL